MAFTSAFRRILSGSSTPSPIFRSQIAWIRHSSTLPTLTSPKLFISGISKNTTDESLFNAFAPFGRLLDSKVIMDRGSGKPKGFGFITYETVEDAEKAREEMNAKYLDGWVIFVDPARPRELPPPPRQHPQQDLQLNPKPTESLFATNRTLGWSG